MRKILIIMFTVLFVSAASATFGSLVYDSEKTAEGLEASYRLGLINGGNFSYRVSFSAESTGNYSIQLPEDRILTPSESGDWNYLNRGGDYTGVEEVSASIMAGMHREKDSARIPVTVTATPIGSPSQDSFWRISQQRTFTLEMDVPDSAPSADEPQQGKQTIYWEEEEGFNFNQNQSGNVENPEEPAADEESSREDGSNRTETGEDQNRGVNTVTFALIIGIAATVFYTLRSL